MRRWLFFLLLLAGLLAPAARAATSPDEMLADPVLEQRARALSKQLRCLVCQNESIDASNAELADDLRRLVRRRLVAGDSDQQIIDFLTARYGDFILLKPPIEPVTWGLWFGPAALLLLGAGGIAIHLRRRHRAEPEALSAAEQTRLEALLQASEAADRSRP
jgi:cytochrome c-type biogenesis protein CcmH